MVGRASRMQTADIQEMSVSLKINPDGTFWCAADAYNAAGVEDRCYSNGAGYKTPDAAFRCLARQLKAKR